MNLLKKQYLDVLTTSFRSHIYVGSLERMIEGLIIHFVSFVAATIDRRAGAPRPPVFLTGPLERISGGRSRFIKRFQKLFKHGVGIDNFAMT